MAFGAVISVKQKIVRLLRPFPQSNIPLPYWEAEFIHEGLCYLETFLEEHTFHMRGRKLRVDPLEEQIELVINQVEQLMETPAASSSNGFLSQLPTTSDCDLIFSQQLIKVKQQLESLINKLKNKELCAVEEDAFAADEEDASGSSRICCFDEEIAGGMLVGLDDELIQLMDWAIGSSDELEIISVVGMVGIGKTTLVRQVYNCPSVVDHFDARIMVTIGPNFKFYEFLLLVLDHVGVDVVKRLQDLDNIDELGVCLQTFLRRKRYLIVLDDVWDIEVWNVVGWIFPADDGNGSRIMLTTRLLDVAHHVGGCSHEKRFLTGKESWYLLRGMVFTSEERCSYQLEKIGKKIAKNCEGLPLAIVSIGKLLCESEKTIQHWKKVSEDENPLKIGIDESTPISKAVTLSYEMLPQYLKVCFLYVGVFPKSYKIFGSKLINLWVAEGFIRAPKPADVVSDRFIRASNRVEIVAPKRNDVVSSDVPKWADVISSDVVSEDTGERRLQELISNSVALVCEPSSMAGRIKSMRVHVVFRNLCVSKSFKENFCQVIKKFVYSGPQGRNCPSRICIHNNVVLGFKQVQSSMKSFPSVHSLLCFGPHHRYLLRVYLCFRSLKVLDALRIYFYQFPCQILELIRLTYLAITCSEEIPNSISKLENLEVLIVGRYHRIKSLDAPTYMPAEIWDLKWLRHLECMGIELPEPPDGYDIQEDLSILVGVSAYTCTQKILERMPYLKKLGIQIELAHGEVENFNFFDNIAQELQYLESFKCTVLGLYSQTIPLPVPTFPSNIRKLALSGCRFPWEHMSAIGRLPRLRVLKLRCYAFSGCVWRPCKGEFLKLKYLVLEDLDLQEWEANYYHFPKLERLFIRHCYKLQQVCTELGNIQTLELMEVEDCNPSIAISAKGMQKEHQLKFKRSRFQVRIHSSWEKKTKKETKKDWTATQAPTWLAT